MGAVAEEHGARAAHVGDDALHLANGAVANELAGDVVGQPPAAGVVHGDDGAVGLAGFDHAGGVVEGGGERLLAGDALYAMVGAVDDDVGVGVVAGGDAEEVQVLFVYHLAVVGVGARLGKHVAPLLAEGVEKLTSQVADGDDLGVGQDGVGADVGVGHGGCAAPPRGRGRRGACPCRSVRQRRRGRSGGGRRAIR